METSSLLLFILVLSGRYVYRVLKATVAYATLISTFYYYYYYYYYYVVQSCTLTQSWVISQLL